MSEKHLLKKIISPLPPIHQEELAHIGAGLRFIESPTQYLSELRQRHGDTYLVDVFGFKLLMTYSAKGLESLYKYEEDEASFAMATFDMIGFKTPIEILVDADSKLFYHLLMHKKMPAYVSTISNTVEQVLSEWPIEKEIDIFDSIRTLEQRVGFSLWLTKEASDKEYWPALKECFDALDQEQSFVNPQSTLETIKTDKSKERAAVSKLYQLIPQIMKKHNNNADKEYATIDFFHDHFSKQDPDISEEALEKRIIHNVMNANQGFLSNLYAGIAWVIVRLIEHPEVLTRVQNEIIEIQKEYDADFTENVEALNKLVYLEQVTMESIRLAQRSLTLRKVMKPIEFDDGNTVYQVEPGIYITTMLSVTNTQSEKLKKFNPDNYDKNQLKLNSEADHCQQFGKESISTFGHGRHGCPAQRFSHHMTKIVVVKLLDRFKLCTDSADFSEPPQPSEKQMGGVSRPQQPIEVSLSLNSSR